MTALDAILLYGNSALLLAILVVMQLRGQANSFPCFFAYIYVVLLTSQFETAMLEIYSLHSTPYYYAYWIVGGIGTVISFFALYELLRHTMTDGTFSLPDWAVIVAFLVLFGASFLITVSLETRGLRTLGFARLVLFSEGVLRFAQIGLLISYLFLTLFFGFYWDRLSFGIAAGFGFYAIILTACWEFGRVYGLASVDNYLRNVPGAAYDISTVIWLRYAMRAPAGESATRVPPDQGMRYGDSLRSILR